MTIGHKEENFEDAIEKVLLDSGYIKRKPSSFDKKLFLDSELFIEFLKDSQPDSWKKLEEDNDEEEILKKLTDEIEDTSMINVIRNGFSVDHIQIDCAFFKPPNAKNPELEEQYQKNILSVTRQAVYDDQGHELDLLLCLNGLPVATAELKNPFTGQDYTNAIKQYKENRDSRNPLFKFKRGALVHFAIDPYEVHMTTRLEDSETFFLPFNKGRDGGSGNPNNPNGYRTSYLWEQIWQKDSWLDIIGSFIDHQIEEAKGDAPPEERIVFPRYHQLEAVRKLTSATKQTGTGENYLIEHSTGSGKSMTIAWLAYKLFSLHDENDKAVFDNVLVLSDRIVLVNQLGDTVKQFEKTEGVVKKVDTSAELANILENYKKIVISTQQKFPFAQEKMSQIKGKNFAIIIDEAHSSQTGESAEKVREVLNNSAQVERESKAEDARKDIVDRIEEKMKSRQPSENLSYYAFTATPKEKTLRLFGKETDPETFVPFHKYPMKQAIDEGFILDVLKNYTTYDTHFKIVQTSAADKSVDGKRAARAVMNYVDSHHLGFVEKSKIIVDHFHSHTLPKMGRRAKAMVIADSRQNARRYKNYIDEYIKSENYQDINTMVAFSGSLEDELGNIHTEQSINNTKSDKEFREKFNSKKYNIMIVAEKYQTGYDQKLLHTMYVDKKLKGIKIIQSLSRLNRTAESYGKTDTFVMDFHNTVDEIKAGYAPYYKGATLIDKTTSDIVENLFNEILIFDIIKQYDLDEFAQIFFKKFGESNDHAMLYAKIDTIRQRFEDADEQTQHKIVSLLKTYVKTFSFWSLIVPYTDINLEKLYALAVRVNSLALITDSGPGDLDLVGSLSLEYYRLEKTHEGGISLDDGQKPLSLTKESSGTVKTPDVLASLSEIIRAINERFSGEAVVDDVEHVIMKQWLEDLLRDPEIRLRAKNNSKDDFMKYFAEKLRNKMLDTPSENYELVAKILKHDDLLRTVIGLAGDPYFEMAKINTLPAIRCSTCGKENCQEHMPQRR